MRKRQSLKITRDRVSVTTEVIDDDASYAQRIAELMASVPSDGGPVLGEFLWATCDGCGATASVDVGDPQYPVGWAEREDGDYCPACQRDRK